MAYTAGLCPNVQTSVERVFGENAPSRKRRRNGFLEAMMSTYNRDGFEVIALDGGVKGKIRTVQIVKNDVMCNDVGTGTYDCTQPFADGIEPVPGQDLINLPANPYVMKAGSTPKRLKLDQWQIRKLCEGEDAFIGRMILQWLLNFEEGFDKAMMAEAAALIGKFADGSTTKSIPLYVNGTDGISAPLKSAQHKFRNEYADIRAVGVPMIIGDNLFQNYNSDVNRGACCNLNGVNMVPSDGWYFFEDDQIESVLGTGGLLEIAPGAMQVVTWNKYAPVETDEYDLKTGQLISPWSGMSYDMRFVWDKQCEAWWFELFSYSQMIAAPKGGCGIANANGSLLWTACAEEEDFDCPPAT